MQLTPEQVKGRIKNVAKENKADARTLMRIYMMERFLERVASSQYKDNFIIKGGMLVTAMVGVALRSTMDIDTSIKNQNLSAEDAKRIVDEVKDINGRITIFRSTLEALGWPTHYRFLYNREAKQVAVQNCTAEDAGAHKTPKLTVSNSCEIKCVALVRMIYRDMRWNRNNTYRLEGKSIPRQQLVSFDLGTPFLVENGKALDENPSPTKPLCGEEVSAAESSSVSPIKRNSGAM